MSVRRRPIETWNAGLGWLRERERSAIVVGAIVGLALAQIHFLGIVVGGLLVGLPARSTRRALVFGFAFGILAWLLFAGWLASNGAFGAYTGMGELALLNVAATLGLPTFGALASRGLS